MRCTQKSRLICAPDTGTFSVADFTDIASCFVAGKQAGLAIGLAISLVIGHLVVCLKVRNGCNPPN